MDTSFMKYKHHKRIKLIFNPASGINKKSPIQLSDIVQELQNWRFIPEIFVTEANTDFDGLVSDAIKDGICLFVVCGGDGTVSAIARSLFNTSGILGIIPIGTQNNVALSLGIPTSIKEAVKILRIGKQIKIDMGISRSGENKLPFIEVYSVGLFSALFQSGDGIQHGDISKLGDFIATFTSSEPSRIHLVLDDNIEINETGHVVMVSNMPFIGRNYRISNVEKSYSDGFLDVLMCCDISKINLMLGYMLKKTDTKEEAEYRLKRFLAKKIFIETNPPMQVMQDGIALNSNSVIIEICHKILNVMAGPEA